MRMGVSQGPSFIVPVTFTGLVVGSKPTYVLVEANFHFLLLFFPAERLFEELKWRNWSLAYGWWALTNDQRALPTLGFGFGKHEQFRCLFKTSKSHQSLRWFWQLQKSEQIVDGWGAIRVRAFHELNFNGPFIWFRATQLRSQSAHGITWLLLLLSSLSSSISLPLSVCNQTTGARGLVPPLVSPCVTPAPLTQITATEPQRNNPWEEIMCAPKAWDRDNDKVFRRFLVLTFAYHNQWK